MGKIFSKKGTLGRIISFIFTLALIVFIAVGAYKIYKSDIKRAEEIAKILGETSVWHTHSRPISIKELEGMRLRIFDYSNDVLKGIIDEYYNMLKDYINKCNAQFFFHTRRDMTWHPY